MDDKQQFEKLVAQAWAQPFSGWDFSYLDGRWREESALPWDYRERARQAIAASRCLLDMGTGGGELLASLAPLPPETYATEAYAPNLLVARRRLEPLGVQVVGVETDDCLPFEDGFFDTVINRHERVVSQEVARILQAGGQFITQQVGERNLHELNACLGIEKVRSSYLNKALAFTRQAGLQVVNSQEAYTETVFYDVGAVVYLLKAAPWQAPGFDPHTHRDGLYAIHELIQAHGQFIAHSHRYFIEARKS